MAGCDGKHYPDWQAVMRHYIGKKHGILDKFVKETLAEVKDVQCAVYRIMHPVIELRCIR